MAYSTARFFLEFFRDNDSYLAGLSYGQWGCVIGLAVGLCVWFLSGRRLKDPNKEEVVSGTDVR